jgi:hypothetical protein
MYVMCVCKCVNIGGRRLPLLSHRAWKARGVNPSRLPRYSRINRKRPVPPPFVDIASVKQWFCTRTVKKKEGCERDGGRESLTGPEPFAKVISIIRFVEKNRFVNKNYSRSLHIERIHVESVYIYIHIYVCAPTDLQLRRGMWK